MIRERILSSGSTTVKDEGYSPPPTRSWKRVLSIPSKEAYLSTSSVTQHPHLSACIITLLTTSCDHNTFFSQFFLKLESLVSLLCLSSQPFLYRPCLPFFPSSARLCVVRIPHPWSGLKAFHMGALPHPIINY
jgi:hypothetical protein